MSLYIWGCNTNDQLGIQTAESSAETNPVKFINQPRAVKALEDHAIADFSAGQYHSLAVTEFGDIYSWGRDKEGQLGHGSRKLKDATPRKIKAFKDQTVVRAACGSLHSMAITASGQLYMWGLLHESRPRTETQGSGDGHDAQTDGNGTNFHGELHGIATDVRDGNSLLQRIVQHSEEQYEMGETTDPDEFEARMLAFITIRKPVAVPRLCESLRAYKISSVAAGFGHSLALDIEGRVFSCGYNENGQLGLGHRISTHEFQQVSALCMYEIEELACGQQHSLARTRIRPKQASSGLCFSWGHGSLGQLGIGKRKSQNLPCHVKLEHPVTSIGAGSYHSVAVLVNGEVYSWGHREYNQHGGGDGMDLNNSDNYKIPRKQINLSQENLKVVSVACGDLNTLALTSNQLVFSWGWNDFGVLGQGDNYRSTAPNSIQPLEGLRIKKITAGGNHCGVLVSTSGSFHALSLRKLLNAGEFYDVEFEVGDEKHSVKAHRFVLSARCPYLDGYIRACTPLLPASERDLKAPCVQVAVPHIAWREFQSLLLYCYTDRLEVATHRIGRLRGAAECMGMDGLKELCTLRLMANRNSFGMDAEATTSEVESSFEADMSRAVMSEKHHPDCYFRWDPKHSEGENTSSAVIPIHRAILCLHEYYEHMFTGGFSEGEEDGVVNISGLAEDGIQLCTFQAVLRWIYTGDCRGNGANTPHRSYENWKTDPAETMEVVALASRLGLKKLIKQCEKYLIQVLVFGPDGSAAVLAEFAEQYGLFRLKSESDAILESLERR